jgi:hypothetical protein
VTNSTFGKDVTVRLPNGTEMITLGNDTFNGQVSLSTGTGSGSTIAIDDSQFETTTHIAMAGGKATLNIETAAANGVGTEFHGQFIAALTGASAVANFGVKSGDTVIFDAAVLITGGTPAATVNVVTAVVTFNVPPVLKNANLFNM